MANGNHYKPPPTPRLSFRQLAPMPQGHRPVFPPGCDEIIQSHASSSATDAQVDAQVFDQLRPTSRNDQHNSSANANHACSCSVCLWYHVFYSEFLKDWYKVMPGQAPPHPLHVEDDELIKSAVALFGHPTIPFPSGASKSTRPSREIMARLQQEHQEARSKA